MGHDRTNGGDTSHCAATLSRAHSGAPFTISLVFTASQFRHTDFSERAMSPFVLVDHFVMTAPTFDVHPHAGLRRPDSQLSTRAKSVAPIV